MSSPGLADFIRLAKEGGSVWLVDGSGQVHAMSVHGYAALPAAALRGSRVFLLEESAREYVAHAIAGNITTNANDK